MTAIAHCPTNGFGFESSLLTSLKSLLPKARTNALDADATLSNARRSYTLSKASGETIVVTFGLDFDPPEWFNDVIHELSTLANLTTDWDSYGGSPVALESVISTLQLLLATMSPTTPLPEFVPTPRGTIQLEWHTRGIDLEIDALGRGLYRLAFENFNADDETIEDKITSNLDDIVGPLSRLS
jgi:hypothetical protein